MIKAEKLLSNYFNVEDYVNNIDSTYILNELKKYQNDFNIYKESDYFLNHFLKKTHILYYIIVDNNILKVIDYYPDSDIYSRKYIYLTNHICIQYLNNTIDDSVFIQKMNIYIFEQFKLDFINHKKLLLKDNPLSIFFDSPKLINMISNSNILNILNNLDISNLDFEDCYNTLNKKLSYEIVLLFNFEELIKQNFRIKQTYIFKKIEKLSIDKNKIELFNKTKNNISNFLFDNVIDSKKKSLTYENYKVFEFAICFVFYGLYFKLFTEEELLKLEQNNFLLFLSEDIYEKELFLHLLNINNINLKNIYTVDHKKHPMLYKVYPESNFNLLYSLEDFLKSEGQKVNCMLEISQKLTEFNSIIFEKSNISIDEIKNIFIEHSNVLAKKNNMSQDEFIKLVKTKIYSE